MTKIDIPTAAGPAPDPAARRALLVTAAGVLVLSVAALMVKLAIDGRAAVHRADAYRDRYAQSADPRDFDFACRWYGSAIRCYLPGAGWVRQAAEELLAWGDALAGAGQATQALQAYEELRSGLRSIRGATQPLSDTLRRAEEKIAALVPPAAPPERVEAG